MKKYLFAIALMHSVASFSQGVEINSVVDYLNKLHASKVGADDIVGFSEMSPIRKNITLDCSIGLLRYESLRLEYNNEKIAVLMQFVDEKISSSTMKSKMRSTVSKYRGELKEVEQKTASLEDDIFDINSLLLADTVSIEDYAIRVKYMLGHNEVEDWLFFNNDTVFMGSGLRSCQKDINEMIRQRDIFLEELSEDEKKYK